MSRFILTISVILTLMYACKEKATVTVTEDPDTTAVITDTVIVKVPKLTRTWESDTTLRTPESVLYDKTKNVLYVSNVGGVPPTKKDGDGFISQLSPDGKIIKLKWATGFDAPKGLGLVGSTLYVTDIDRIKAVDTKTGKILNTWKVPGATYLNDVAISTDSIVYFTDFEKSTIHQLRKGKLSVVRVDTSLGGTNGIYVDGNTLLLAGSQTGNVYTMNIGDQSVQTMASGIPSGDGIERYKNGWIVSNWNGQIYHIDDTGKVTMVLDTQGEKLNSADIEVIEEKDLLIVPTFFGNKVVAYTMKG
jgi:hypothetical protein